MINIRPSNQRGHANHGWLDTYHTFSFSNYYDPKFMGFRALRVINEDRVAPGQGFGTHGHNDMEILTVVLEGALEHKDSMGNKGAIRPGEVQRMSAGTGVRHSEFNHSEKQPVHLLQIWIEPEKRGITPSYEQKAFSVDERKNTLKLLATRNPENGAVKINQDASLLTSILEPGKSLEYTLSKKRYAWLQVARGAVTVNGKQLDAGDGAAIEKEEKLAIANTGSTEAEILLFDLA
jgi:redox-sensitive bicupin YhaK (pirin superfamily)